ncbi:unnamed protein product [Adineta steineri]|uniref:Cadherin domain-containing protein n=1 Tax=Adineta steineri TaxID=433720 RepID=A0A813P6K0_9BILA|nr:unnamed protein product [Adineta steineri]
MKNIHYFIILFSLLLPNVLTYDCQEICNITVYVNENTPNNELQWNLINLLSNRTLKSDQYEKYQYSLSNPSDYFEIQSPMLKFRLNELDREKICNKIFFHDDECSLQLQIFTPTSFIILFKLVILDINDWKPYFKNDYIHINIRENLPINYRVQLPIAYDHDSSKYNIDHYEFITNDTQIIIKDIFQLEQIHDELRLKLLKKLDCEQKDNYQLEILAIDKGGLKSNILHVNITIDDLNEFQPRFKQRLYHTRISEDTPVSNNSILNTIATDDDCYDKIILYSLLPGDVSNDVFPFEINKYTGSIYIIHELDYEKISTYRFRVKASNLDKVTSSIVPVIIDILDINDNQPLIQMNILNDYKTINANEDQDDFIININENIRLKQVIGTILIRDLDSMTINKKLSLKILSCWPLKNPCPIELDSGFGNSDENEKNLMGSTNYLIRTSRLLDSENGDERFTIVLEARDYGDPALISQRRLVILIHDQNDCIPVFSQTNYQFRLSETTPVGFPIGHIEAIDHDLSDNFRRIQYKQINNENNRFIDINPNNGSVYLIEKLSAGMTLNISVMAIDQQNESLYDRTNIQVLSYNEEECLPTFTQKLYIFNTTEHKPTPYEIGQVSADSCLSTSIEFSYHLVKDTSSPTSFSIDTRNGRITVTRELDREIQSFYKFYVESFNHKSHQTSQTEVHINILDENDHYPIFDNSLNNAREQYIYINKSLSLSRRHEIDQTTNNIFIARIYATDEDDGSNGVVNYYFTNPDNYAFFHLYSNGSIVLYNQNNLRLPYRLEIYARDQGNPAPQNSKDSIVIYICDGLKREECPSDESYQQHQEWLYSYDNNNNNQYKTNPSTTNFYLGSVFIMISILLCIVIIIFCIVWNLIIRRHLKSKHEQIHNNGLKSPTESYNCRMEARKNLLVSDSLCDSSPIIDGNHRLKSVAV